MGLPRIKPRATGWDVRMLPPGWANFDKGVWVLLTLFIIIRQRQDSNLGQQNPGFSINDQSEHFQGLTMTHFSGRIGLWPINCLLSFYAPIKTITVGYKELIIMPFKLCCPDMGANLGSSLVFSHRGLRPFGYCPHLSFKRLKEQIKGSNVQCWLSTSYCMKECCVNSSFFSF